MFRKFTPLSRHFNVLQSPERLSSQVLRLNRYELQSRLIKRLIHKKVNSKPDSKDTEKGIFKQLRTIKVEKTSKFDKRSPRQYDNKRIYREKNDIFNVIRPQLNDDEDSLEDRLFEYERYTYEQREEYLNSKKVLSATMTPELEEQILEGRPNQKLFLRQAILDLERMETKTGSNFSVPPSLSIDEWRTFISLYDFRSRYVYIHYLVIGNPSLEEILKQDQIYHNPLQLDPEITKKVTDEEGQRRIKIFLMEHEMMRQNGELVPYNYLERDVFNISELATPGARAKFLGFLLKREFLQLMEEMKKRQKEHEMPKAKEERHKKAKEAEIFYGLGYNTIHIRHNKQTLSSIYDWHAIRENHEWGIPLLIDLSHTSNYKLNRSRYTSIINELRNATSVNKMAKTPFQLHITDVQLDVTPRLIDQLSNMKEEERTSYNITSESHLDMFPHERLVYLSPDSRNDLIKFNPDDIYVIGGIIDTYESIPLSLSVAKKLKIRHARFPMRQALGMQSALNIDTCVAIMNDFKETNDWFFSMRWTPSRYLFNRLKNQPAKNAEYELIFRAHRQLSPTTPDSVTSRRNSLLTAAQYRHYYKKIMECKSKEEIEALLDELVI